MKWEIYRPDESKALGAAGWHESPALALADGYDEYKNKGRYDDDKKYIIRLSDDNEVGLVVV